MRAEKLSEEGRKPFDLKKPIFPPLTALRLNQIEIRDKHTKQVFSLFDSVTEILSTGLLHRPIEIISTRSHEILPLFEPLSICLLLVIPTS